MTGQMVQEGEDWFWRRKGQPDIRVRHNPWGKTAAAQDMPKLARALDRVDDQIEQARAAICRQNYDNWREGWRYPDEPDLTEAEFAARLAFEGISYPAAAALHSQFDLSFDDGGLFAGHGFSVSFTLDGRLDRVEMIG